MIAFTSKLDTRDVEKGLRALLQEGHSRGVLAALKQPVRADQKEHAKRQEGPDGRWPSRAASTVAKRRRLKSRRLVRGPNRKLLNTLPRRTVTVKATGSKVYALSKVPWAGVHQHGGRAGRGAVIPARKFLWFSDDFYTEANGIICDRLQRAWSR